MKNIKNIVWILTDSQHAEAVGYMGNKAVHTPNLDKLAAKSQIFTNAHCQSPICVPSRESFITGRYPSDLGILHNKHDHASTAETLGHKFQQAGFKTCFSGKSHFIADNLRFADHDMERGFERYADWDDYLHYLRDKNFFSKIDKNKVKEGCYQDDPREMREIEGAANRCYNVYAQVHNGQNNAYNTGFDLAQAYAEEPELSEEPGRTKEINSYDKFRLDYFRSINYVDRYVGKMMDKLEVLGHKEDTMIVFTSDHGDMIGEHGLNFKMCFYDAAIKVPLLIHIPGEWDQGEREDRPVMLLDLVPTIAGQFGVEIEEDLPGIDLRSNTYNYDRPVYSEIVSSFGADIAQYGFENHVRMVKTDRWKYLSKAFGQHELYNMVEDPTENNNLGEHPAYQTV